MLKQLFASMHDVLDDVMRSYPAASAAERHELHKKLEVLRTMSDSLIEEWLQFEEKMTAFLENLDTGKTYGGLSDANVPGNFGNFPDGEAAESFKKGQGYYQLYMFDKAIREFEKVVNQHPDFCLARLFLAMGHLRSGNDTEAYRHFKLITSLTDQAQIKSISYNAMGCIQAKNANLDQARELFEKAHQADPSSPEPMINMEICMSHQENAGSDSGFVL
jgi:tetratricopeptide (TPR) repeat protein